MNEALRAFWIAERTQQGLHPLQAELCACLELVAE
jgi:hypothetical protein